MDNIQKEYEVYSYVKQNKKYIDAIIRGVMDGYIEEIDELRESKAFVEIGLASVLTKKRMKKLDINEKDLVVRALENCKALNMTTTLEKIRGISEEKDNG